jgi:hypothetical protein
LGHESGHVEKTGDNGIPRYGVDREPGRLRGFAFLTHFAATLYNAPQVFHILSPTSDPIGRYANP